MTFQFQQKPFRQIPGGSVELFAHVYASTTNVLRQFHFIQKSGGNCLEGIFRPSLQNKQNSLEETLLRLSLWKLSQTLSILFLKSLSLSLSTFISNPFLNLSSFLSLFYSLHLWTLHNNTPVLQCLNHIHTLPDYFHDQSTWSFQLLSTLFNATD